MKIDICDNCKHKTNIWSDELNMFTNVCGRLKENYHQLKDDTIRCRHHDYSQDMKDAIDKYEEYVGTAFKHSLHNKKGEV